MNSRLAVTQESVSVRSLTSRQLTAMAGDFARAGLLTLAGVTVVALGAVGLATAPETAHVVAGLVLVSAVGLMLGADLRTVAGGRRVWAAFGLGAALSAVSYPASASRTRPRRWCTLASISMSRTFPGW